MIKVDKGNVACVGDLALILAELQTLVHSLHHHAFISNADIPAEKSREMILKAVENGLANEEQTERECKKENDRLSEVLDALARILTGKDDE